MTGTRIGKVLKGTIQSAIITLWDRPQIMYIYMSLYGVKSEQQRGSKSDEKLLRNSFKLL